MTQTRRAASALGAAWRDFADGQPGRRFQDRYRRRCGAGTRTTRTLGIAAGAALFLLGLVFLVAPGPGLLLVLPGAALIAQESLTLARAMDAAEVRLRQLFRRRA